MIDKLAWIYIKDKKVLCCLSKGKTTYYSPGGKRQEGENDVEALVREIKEEVNVDLILDTVRYYGAFKAQAHGKPEGTYVKMSCYLSEYSGELEPNNEIEKIEWLDSKNLDLLSDVGKIIFKDLAEKGLIE